MKIIGIDPGTIAMGWSIVEYDMGTNSFSAVRFGIIQVPQRRPIAQRLADIFVPLCEMVSREKPDEIAMEDVYLGKSLRAALALGQAQCLVILAGAMIGRVPATYANSKIKVGVCGKGGGDKDAVAAGLARMFPDLDPLPEPGDAADAVGVAICHARELELKARLVEDRP